ncbi:MAG: putative metal-binding motif-containing protein [Flavobacteriales bacterium]|nr:putative metal-binding motif-containing protein [Flavobacteriales bacterium]
MLRSTRNAIEIRDGADNNCDGNIDGINAFADPDGDGFGDVNLPLACGTPGSVGNSNDCNDGDATQYPGAPELCDALDNDCDGTVDDGLGLFADSDGDGYGDPLQPLACNVVGVANDLDCDDTDANPSSRTRM